MEEDVFSDEYNDVVSDFTNFNGHNKDLTFGRPRLESRMSICLPSKGLINEPGENNCFLNASIQLLWHVNVFRRSFRLLEGHACVENACIFCALKKIFHQLEDSDASALAADDLRQAMANAFVDERRFQLGRMDDAAECLENILTRLHCHIAWRESEDSCSASHCISHQKFALNVLEQTSCKCRATSEPKSYYQFVYYVHASALVEQARFDRKYQVSFGELLRTTAQQGEKRPCPDEKRCSYKGSENTTRVQTTLCNRPDVLTVGVIWDTECPSSQYIDDVMDCISENFFIIDLFDNILDDEYKRLEMKLVGVVTYYGRHYTSFFYNINEKQWMYFDDAQVSKIGSSWKKVKQKCHRTHFQPLLIVFSNGGGLPVATDDALKTREYVSKEILLSVKPPPTKPSSHRKKKKHRRNNRNGSRSPLGKSNGHYADERSSSRSSNGSQSPKSPKRNIYIQKESKHTIPNVDGRYKGSNEELSSLSQSTGSYSKPPNALLRGSASDGSIADCKEYVDSHAPRKRSDSMKKKFGGVFKAMNPKYRSFKSSKSSNSSNSNTEANVDTGMRDFLKPDTGNFADVGFDDNPRKVKGKSPVHSRDHSPSEEHPKSQLKNLELHKEYLKTRDHSNNPPNPHHIHRDGDLSSEYDAEYVSQQHHSDDFHRENVAMQHRQINGSKDYSVDQTDSTQEFHSATNEHTEELFQELLTKGDRYLGNADYYERKGDILYALQLCTSATSVFREASKLSGISEDLLQFVDNKRSESFQRSQEIQQSLENFFDNKRNTTTHDHVSRGRTDSTSGYSSMSDSTLRAETPDNNHEYMVDDDTRNDDINDMITLQNSNARQQALERLQSDQYQQEQQQQYVRPSHQHTSADTLRRKSLELLERRDSGNSNPGSRPPPPRCLNVPRTSTLPVDYTLRQPKIPTPTVRFNRDSPRQLVKAFPSPSIERNDVRKSTDFSDGFSTLQHLNFSQHSDHKVCGTFPTKSLQNTDSQQSAQLRHSGNDEITSRRNKEHVRSIYDNVDDEATKTSGCFRHLLHSDTKSDFINDPTQLLSNPPSASLHSTSTLRSMPTPSHTPTTPTIINAPPQHSTQTAYESVHAQHSVNEFSSHDIAHPDIVYDKQNTLSENFTDTTTSVMPGRDLIKKLNSQDDSQEDDEYKTIYDDIVLTNDKLPHRPDGTEVASTFDSKLTSEQQPPETSVLNPKELIKKFNNASLSSSNNSEELNTLQRLKKEGKTIFRCPQCKFRHVDVQGEYCENCRTEYMTMLKKKIAGEPNNDVIDPPSSTLQPTKDRTKKTKSPKSRRKAHSPVPADNSAISKSPKTLRKNIKTEVNTANDLKKTFVSEFNVKRDVVSSKNNTLENLKKHVQEKFKCVQCGWKQVEIEGQCCVDCQSEYL